MASGAKHWQFDIWEMTAAFKSREEAKANLGSFDELQSLTQTGKYTNLIEWIIEDQQENLPQSVLLHINTDFMASSEIPAKEMSVLKAQHMSDLRRQRYHLRKFQSGHLNTLLIFGIKTRYTAANYLLGLEMELSVRACA